MSDSFALGVWQELNVLSRFELIGENVFFSVKQDDFMRSIESPLCFF